MPFLEEHGIGLGKYRKGSEIAGLSLKPLAFPVAAKASSTFYMGASSMSRSFQYDKYSDTVLVTTYDGSTTTAIRIYKASDMTLLKYFIVGSNNGGSGISLMNAPLYVTSKGWIIANFTDANSFPTRYMYIYNANATGPTIGTLKTFANVNVSLVLEVTDTYMLFVNNANAVKKVQKYYFDTDIFEDVQSLTANGFQTGNGYSYAINFVHGWDKWMYRDSSGNVEFYGLDGKFIKRMTGLSDIASLPMFYHAPSGTLIALRYTYGTSGGHFLQKFNSETMVLISSTRMTTMSEISISSWQSTNFSYNRKHKSLMLATTCVNAVPTILLFNFNDDGTIPVTDLDTNVWMQHNSKVPRFNWAGDGSTRGDKGIVGWGQRADGSIQYLQPWNFSHAYTIAK